MISPNLKTPRICLIGVSGYASVYVDWLLEAHANDRLIIGAVVALKSEQNLSTTRKLLDAGAALYDSYDALFKKESGCCDLCYIPTGIQWHARMAIAALRSGCNVLVEKPLAGSVKDAKRVQEVEKETGRFVAVGFQDMYTDEMAELKQSLLDGKIGRIQSISMMGTWPRPESYYRRNHWAGRIHADDAQVLDSPLNNAFAHFVNLSLFLAGESLYASQTALVKSAQLLRAHDIESFDTAVVLAEAPTGLRFWFGVSHACQKTREPSIRIIGENGSIEWLHNHVCLIKIKTQDGIETAEKRKVPCYDETRRKMFDTVLQRMINPKAPICHTDIAIRHTELIESIHNFGEVVTVDSELIDRVAIEGTDSKVPAIREIEQQLEMAYQNLAELGDLRVSPAKH